MSLLSVALRKIRSAATFSATELALVPLVFVLLGVARLAILMLPFRSYVGLFGEVTDLSTVQGAATARAMSRQGSVGRVVRRTAKITPWESLCLAQAMVASVLLRASGVSFLVFFGVARADGDGSSDPLAAHCWVRVGEVNVTGGQNVSRFTVVKAFARPGTAA